MKKLTKATIAATAGVALLLGTGGTLAYWNATTPLGAAKTTITAGNLAVTPGATPAWTLQRGTAAAQTVDPATVRIVPGDKLTYTTTFDITAQGRNLALSVDATPGSVAAPATGATAADTALANYLNTNKVGTIKIGTGAAAPLTPGTPVAVPATGNDAVQTIPVTVTYTLTFPYSDTVAGDENAAKTGKVDVSQFSVNVRQTANGA